MLTICIKESSLQCPQLHISFECFSDLEHKTLQALVTYLAICESSLCHYPGCYLTSQSQLAIQSVSQSASPNLSTYVCMYVCRHRHKKKRISLSLSSWLAGPATHLVKSQIIQNCFEVDFLDNARGINQHRLFLQGYVY